MKNRTEAVLIEKLSSNRKSDRQEVMLHFYQNMYEQVERYVLKNNGSVTEAKDVFQDSLVALYKHAQAGRFSSNDRIEGYFFTICKNYWLKELQKKSRITELTPNNEQQVDTETQESIMVTNEKVKLLEELIARLGSDCYQLLRYFYYEKKRMKEIAVLLSMTNAQAAKDKKASCMKKLRTMVHGNTHFIEMLKS